MLSNDLDKSRTTTDILLDRDARVEKKNITDVLPTPTSVEEEKLRGDTWTNNPGGGGRRKGRSSMTANKDGGGGA